MRVSILFGSVSAGSPVNTGAGLGFVFSTSKEGGRGETGGVLLRSFFTVEMASIKSLCIDSEVNVFCADESFLNPSPAKLASLDFISCGCFDTLTMRSI